MRRLLLIVFTLIFLTGIPVSNGFRQEYRIRTVVIDAGHGGHDSGCLGASAKEKTVALSVALKLGRMIEEAFPDVKIIYTRKTDVFIPLHERADIANHNKADLFICIHCNSGNKAAFGVETYVMGLHKTEDNLAVAKRENASVLLEEDYKKQYEGFDPNSPEANIIFNLYQNQFLNQSLMFASNVQEEVVEYAGRHNRGVKQAGFLVLYKTAMPSVLIETGFLTNEDEEKYMLTDKGQSNVASSVFRAFRKYKVDIETPGTDNNIVKDDSETDNSNKPVVVPDTTAKLVKGLPKTDSPPAIKTTAQESQKAPVTMENKNTAPSSVPIAKSKTPEVYFTVQIGASQKPEKDAAHFSKVSGLNAVNCEDGYTRFNSGNFNTLAAAKIRQSELKSDGYKDCFIVAYNGNKKISITEATSLLQKK
ncbi:MAG: N-acetylmuramoyl-L-alanine amidase [Bacteroidota bacterium]